MLALVLYRCTRHPVPWADALVLADVGGLVAVRLASDVAIIPAPYMRGGLGDGDDHRPKVDKLAAVVTPVAGYG